MSESVSYSSFSSTSASSATRPSSMASCDMKQGRSQNFSKGGGGGHTGSNNIVMAFSPRNIVGCLLKKRFTKGGITGTPGPP